MAKFKVGDRVRINPKLTFSHYLPTLPRQEAERHYDEAIDKDWVVFDIEVDDEGTWYSLTCLDYIKINNLFRRMLFNGDELLPPKTNDVTLEVDDV